MKRRTASFLLVLAVAVVACTAGTAAGSEGITEGHLAKDFALDSLDGGKVALSDYRGKTVVLNFWATWCPPCQAEIPDLEAAYRSHREEDLVVVGVSVQDTLSIVQQFSQSMGMTYPILFDTDGQIYRLYRAPGLPMTLILDSGGIIQVRHIGLLSGEMLEDYLSRVMPSS